MNTKSIKILSNTAFILMRRLMFFFDPLRMERLDIDSKTEIRWQTMGFFGDVLFVIYTERGEKIRIISARPAEPFERRIYYGNCEIHGWRRVY
jgi:uncharacterized DUF497 family protein